MKNISSVEVARRVGFSTGFSHQGNAYEAAGRWNFDQGNKRHYLNMRREFVKGYRECRVIRGVADEPVKEMEVRLYAERIDLAAAQKEEMLKAVDVLLDKVSVAVGMDKEQWMRFRNPENVDIKRICAMLIRERWPLVTLVEIGEKLHKHYSTVLLLLRRGNDLMSVKDELFLERYNHILKIVDNG